MFSGHALQRHDLIGCSETRTDGAQSVSCTVSIPLECVFFRTGVHFSSCAVNKPLFAVSLFTVVEVTLYRWVAVLVQK